MENTNHKELFDQIIGEENTNTIPEQKESAESIEEKLNDGCIPLKSCTGVVYFIDPNDPQNAELFAPDNLLTHVSNFSQQEDSLINIERNLLMKNSIPEDEFKEYVTNITGRLEESLKGFGVDVSAYKDMNGTLTDYEYLTFLVFDLFSFTKTLNHFLVSMSMANMMMGAHSIEGMTDDKGVFEPGEVELPTPEKKENKGYKVYATVTDSGKVDIIQVDEEYSDPSDMYIVHNDDSDGVYYVYTIAESEEDAAKSAKIVFDGFARNMNETDFDKAIRIAEEMNSSSGLID